MSALACDSNHGYTRRAMISQHPSTRIVNAWTWLFRIGSRDTLFPRSRCDRDFGAFRPGPSHVRTTRTLGLRSRNLGGSRFPYAYFVFIGGGCATLGLGVLVLLAPFPRKREWTAFYPVRA
jgi:hypothetical protein